MPKLPCPSLPYHHSAHRLASLQLFHSGQICQPWHRLYASQHAPIFVFRMYKTSSTPTCCTLLKHCKENARSIRSFANLSRDISLRLPPLWTNPSGRNMHRTKERDHWALTIFLYGIEEPNTRTALMNLELSNIKGQESAKKVERELEVSFDENGGIVTPAIRRMQTRNNSVSSLETTTDWSLRLATRTRYHFFWALRMEEVRITSGFTRARLLYSPFLLSIQAMIFNFSRLNKFHAVRQFRWHPSSWLHFSHTIVRVEISPKFM
jgi:hypothetical protein